jgi:tRNA G18 (ribose-2'-O)-methylase SpoU
MFQRHRIDSLDLPDLAPYRTMRRPIAHRDQGIFVAEGEKVVRRLLESPFPVQSVLLPEKWVADFTPLLEARPENLPVYVVDKKDVLEQLIGFSMFQGVMAVGRIPAPTALEDMLANPKSESRSRKPASARLFVAVDALTNAENLGVLVRNCVAFRVEAFIVGETCCSPYLRRSVRNSMGTIFQLPVVEPAGLVAALQTLQQHGVRCVAAHPHASGKTLSQAALTGDTCIVFGSEGYGISAPVLAACDDAVAIPMPPTVDSLNVGSAAAVFLYEVNRQRGFT